MRKFVVVALVYLVIAVPLLGADKTWIGGTSSNWFDADNWTPAGVPASSDSVAITNLTTVVITGNVAVASLELRRATLVASNQLTVTNFVIAESARLNAWMIRPSPFTNPPTGFGIVEIPSQGTLLIGNAGLGGVTAFSMEGTKLNLRGTGFCTNRVSILLFYRSELNVYGTLNLNDEITFDGANGPPSGSLNNYGLLQRSSGTNLSFLSANITNRGTVLLQSGTMNLGNGLNSGVMNLSYGCTQSFSGAPFVWEGGQFVGGGTVLFTRGSFDPGTNDLFIPQLRWRGANLLGTNTVTVGEWQWEGGSGSGGGDLIADFGGHLSIETGGEKFLGGQRRLITRGKISMATNASLSLSGTGPFINQGFLVLGAGARISSSPTAAPPGRFFRNERNISCPLTTTNSILARFTNAGTLSVEGQLQITDAFIVQSAGNTTVNGKLIASPGYLLTGGTLTGTGSVSGVVRSAATIAPAGIGQLSILGSLTNRGNILIELGTGSGGPISDSLSVANHLGLGGTLAVCYTGSASPDPGSVWEVLRFGSSSGTFNSLQGLDLGGGRVLHPIFSATNLVLALSNQPPTLYTFSTVQCAPGQFELRFTGDPAQRYSIDVSTNLPDWTSSVLVTNAPEGIIYFRDSLTNFPRRFYRARQL
jgi:hypothetical protein